MYMKVYSKSASGEKSARNYNKSETGEKTIRKCDCKYASSEGGTRSKGRYEESNAEKKGKER